MPFGQRLGVGGQVWRDAELRLHATECRAEPGQHFIHDEDGSVLVAAGADQLQEAWFRRNAAGVEVDPLAEDRRQLIPVLRHRRLEGRDIVPGDHDHISGARGGDTTGGGHDLAFCGQRIVRPVEPRFGETVEVAIELQVLAAAGGVAGNAQRHQRHLAADAGEAHALGGGDDLDDARRQLLVEGGLRRADDAQLHPVQHGLFHGWVIMSEQRGAIRHIEVDVACAIEAEEVGAGAALRVQRAAQVGVEAHGGGNTARQYLLGLGKVICSGCRGIDRAHLLFSPVTSYTLRGRGRCRALSAYPVSGFSAARSHRRRCSGGELLRRRLHAEGDVTAGPPEARRHAVCPAEIDAIN